MTQSHFGVPKNDRLNSTLCFVMKTLNKRLQLTIHQVLVLKTLAKRINNVLMKLTFL